MKTEMKMIAAILAVLAVALGGVYALDMEQADAADNIPAIWPGVAPTGVTGYEFDTWMPGGEAKPAAWENYEDYYYWLDTVNGADWITVLGNTQVDFGGHSVAYRDKAIMPAGKTDPRYADVEIEFYNDYANNTFRVENTTVAAIALAEDLSKCDEIETTAGTVYIGGLDVTITGRYYVSEQDTTGKAYTKTISIPVLVQKISLQQYDENYEYTYNALYQTPMEMYGDNGNASDVYFYLDVKKGLKDPADAVAYAPAEDNNGKQPFVYPADLADVVKEDEWVVTGTKWACGTNKDAGVETYVIEISAPDNEYVNGKITLTWVILPLGLDDIEFTITGPYYNFDQEVRPSVSGVWYEPLDGPNTVNGVAKKHNVNFSQAIITYTMPEDYPYEMGTMLVPQYQQAVDEDGTPQTKKVVMLKYEEATDNTPEENIIEVTDASGTTTKYDKTKPVWKMNNGEKVQAVDVFGNPVTVQSKDAYGNLLWELTDENGKTMEVTFRYSDMTFVYEKKIDADGNIVDDLEKPVMVAFKIPVYDDDNNVIDMEACTYYLKAVTEPVYVQETMEVIMPVYDETKPVIVQEIDEYGRPMYKDYVYQPLTYWNGEIVYEQEVKNGKIVDKVDANGNKIPVLNKENPVLEQIYKPQTDTDGKIVYEQDGITPVWDETKPVLDADGNPVFAPKYDVNSGKKMTEAYEEVEKPFTATQVGVPSFNEGEVFVYGIRIVLDTGFYEFDTDDYAPSSVKLAEAEGLVGGGEGMIDDDNDTGENAGNDTVTGASDITKEIKGSAVPGLAYDLDGNLLYKPELTIVDENGKVPYLTFTGKVYNENLFTWSIKPLPFNPDWYNKEEEKAVVPAGYANPDAYNSKGELIDYEPWADSFGIVIPDKILDEDYTIVPLDYDPSDYDIEDGNDTEPYAWPYLGQYDEGYPMIEFPYGANFYNDMSYVSLNWPFMLTLNVDTLEVTGPLNVNDLKQAVHFYPMDMYLEFQSFSIEDFFITVLNGDGEVVIFQDQVVRNILASDWYTITVTGNVANGYYGTLFGSFFIDKEVSEVEITEFETEDYTAVRYGKNVEGVRITGYTGNGGDVIIPDYIGGKMVLAIKDKAFYGNKDITSVTMGKFVRTIGTKAFAACSNLTSVEFNDETQVIGAYAFFGDKAITKVIFGNELRKVRENAFSVEFISGLAAEDYTGQTYVKDTRAVMMPSIVPVYGNYADENGKTQYYAKDALAGRVFITIEDVDDLVGTHLDMFFDFEKVITPTAFDDMEKEVRELPYAK